MSEQRPLTLGASKPLAFLDLTPVALVEGAECGRLRSGGSAGVELAGISVDALTDEIVCRVRLVGRYREIIDKGGTVQVRCGSKKYDMELKLPSPA
jgi:hypothetical protein